ncbi:MAG TPA: glycosyltransferase N-terminal domain-containing protein, partial [Candidatus Kapabacteria bacterium]|nr:glycosyltransferase N-terminal domain-containing protein [Candidatus Kapabacteria bacterium]
MTRLWLIIYNVCVVPLMWIVFRIAGFFNDKIQRGLDGRKSLLSKVRAKLTSRGNAKTVWIHVASLGEFEQAKPVIEALKERFPSVFIFVSFFSPSGFDYALDYKPADAVAYLPFDSFFAAKKFVEIVRPSAAIFVRYELWLNHLWALHMRNIPVILVCASAQNFEKKNSFVRSFNRNAFKNFTQVLCVTESDAVIYKSNLDSITPVIVAGDTKYDRVSARARDAKNIVSPIEKIASGKFVLVAGSTWGEDEAILVPAIKHLAQEYDGQFLCIIAPHEPTPQHLALIEADNRCCRLSGMDLYNNESILLVDSVGNLFSLYQYANVV